MRGTATAPNSPREIGVGEVSPRAIMPDMASKSKVMQTRCRPMRVRNPDEVADVRYSAALYPINAADAHPPPAGETRGLYFCMTAPDRARARELGVAPGIFPTGRFNAITDVAG